MQTSTTLSEDPTAIIALASSALAGKGPIVRARDVAIGKNDHLVSERSYPEVSELRSVPLSLRPVIDALSEVSVLSDHNPKLACGLRAHDSTHTLELIISGNRTVHDLTVQHLIHTWEFMGRISVLHASSNATQSQKEDMDVQFWCSTISFAISDLRLAFKETLQRMLEYQRKCDDAVANSPPSERRFYERSLSRCSKLFLEVLKCVEKCSKCLQNLSSWNVNLGGDDYTNWKEFYNLGNELLSRSTALLGEDMISSTFSKWERFVSSYIPTPTSLRKDIETVSRLPRHIRALVTFAHSAQHKTLLGQALIVSKLEPVRPRDNFTWPSDANTWETIRDIIYEKHRYVINNPSSGLSDDTAALLSQDPTTFVQHAELSLLTYLHLTLRSDRVRTYNYIGISGLACKACSIWIRAFNDAHREVNFGISGSNNEWVPGWFMPPLAEESQEFREMVVSDTLDVYFWYMRAKKISRKDPALTPSEFRDWRREEDWEEQHPSY